MFFILEAVLMTIVFSFFYISSPGFYLFFILFTFKPLSTCCDGCKHFFFFKKAWPWSKCIIESKFVKLLSFLSMSWLTDWIVNRTQIIQNNKIKMKCFPSRLSIEQNRADKVQTFYSYSLRFLLKVCQSPPINFLQ